MKIVADTNVILRLLVSGASDEDARQALVVAELLERCEAVIFPTHAFCEMVWVMQRGYRFTAAEIVAGIKKVLCIKNLVFKKDEVEAGLRMLEKGGDFADGVNARAGRTMASDDGAVFASFDKEAVKLLNAQGVPVLLLETPTSTMGINSSPAQEAGDEEQ